MMDRLRGCSREEALKRTPHIPNVLCFIFAPETGFYDMFSQETEEERQLREEVLVSNVQLYRRTSLPFRASLRWKRLWEWLTRWAPAEETRRRFLDYWEKAWQRDDRDGNVHRVYMMRFSSSDGADPVVLRYLAVVSQEIVRRDRLYITTYVPLDGTTAKTFSRLAKGEGRDESQSVLDLRVVVDFLFPPSEEGENAGSAAVG